MKIGKRNQWASENLFSSNRLPKGKKVSILPKKKKNAYNNGIENLYTYIDL